MVAVVYICLFALILVINSVNAYNLDNESALREQNPSNSRQVHQRGKRRRGLSSSKGKGSGKGGGAPNPNPLPTPVPTPPPTLAPTPPPTNPVPTSMPSAKPTNSPTSSPSAAPSAAPSESETFVSYVRLEVQTAGGEPDLAALNAVATLAQDTYNAETGNCDDPFGRKMTDTEFFSVSSVDRRKNRHRRTKAMIKGGPSERKLQNLNIFVFLKVNGRCNGCANNQFFFNQVVGRRLQTCTSVPPDSFLATMNTSLMAGGYGTIQQADSVADVPMPTSSSSAKGSSSKGTAKSGKGYSYEYYDHDN